MWKPTKNGSKPRGVNATAQTDVSRRRATSTWSESGRNRFPENRPRTAPTGAEQWTQVADSTGRVPAITRRWQALGDLNVALGPILVMRSVGTAGHFVPWKCGLQTA
jgi:hypothetical protein